MRNALYVPPRAQAWHGRIDKPITNDTLRWHQNIKFLDVSKNIPTPDAQHFNIGLLGFCSDAGIRRNQGRIGAKEGPKAIRQALANLPLPALEKPLRIFDAGDIMCRGNTLESAQQALGQAVNILLKKNIFPIVLGGGHDVAWGQYLGLKPHVGQTNFGIVNIDAHFDLRSFENGGHSGSPFLQIAADRNTDKASFSYFCLGIQKSANTQSLFKTAKHLNVEWLLAENMGADSLKKNQKTLHAFIQKHKHIYLTICLDAFAAAFAPGVSAPSALGILPQQILPFLDQICASGRVVSLDVAELSPKHDLCNITAKLAAQLIFAAVCRLKA